AVDDRVGIAEYRDRQRAAEVDVEALVLAGLVDVAEPREVGVHAAAQLAALLDGVHHALRERGAEDREQCQCKYHLDGSLHRSTFLLNRRIGLTPSRREVKGV